jgi:hypothetical protein
MVIGPVAPFLQNLAFPKTADEQTLRILKFGEILAQKIPPRPSGIPGVVVWVKDVLFSIYRLFYSIIYETAIREARFKIIELCGNRENAAQIVKLALPHAKVLPDFALYFSAFALDLIDGLEEFDEIQLLWKNRGYVLSVQPGFREEKSKFSRPLLQAFVDFFYFETALLYPDDRHINILNLLEVIKNDLTADNALQWSSLLGDALPQLLDGDLEEGYDIMNRLDELTDHLQIKLGVSRYHPVVNNFHDHLHFHVIFPILLTYEERDAEDLRLKISDLILMRFVLFDDPLSKDLLRRFSKNEIYQKDLNLEYLKLLVEDFLEKGGNDQNRAFTDFLDFKGFDKLSDTLEIIFQMRSLFEVEKAGNYGNEFPYNPHNGFIKTYELKDFNTTAYCFGAGSKKHFAVSIASVINKDGETSVKFTPQIVIDIEAWEQKFGQQVVSSALFIRYCHEKAFSLLDAHDADIIIPYLAHRKKELNEGYQKLERDVDHPERGQNAIKTLVTRLQEVDFILSLDFVRENQKDLLKRHTAPLRELISRVLIGKMDLGHPHRQQVQENLLPLKNLIELAQHLFGV